MLRSDLCGLQRSASHRRGPVSCGWLRLLTKRLRNTMQIVLCESCKRRDTTPRQRSVVPRRAASLQTGNMCDLVPDYVAARLAARGDTALHAARWRATGRCQGTCDTSSGIDLPYPLPRHPKAADHTTALGLFERTGVGCKSGKVQLQSRPLPASQLRLPVFAAEKREWIALTSPWCVDKSRVMGRLTVFVFKQSAVFAWRRTQLDERVKCRDLAIAFQEKGPAVVAVRGVSKKSQSIIGQDQDSDWGIQGTSVDALLARTAKRPNVWPFKAFGAVQKDPRSPQKCTAAGQVYREKEKPSIHRFSRESCIMVHVSPLSRPASRPSSSREPTPTNTDFVALDPTYGQKR